MTYSNRRLEVPRESQILLQYWDVIHGQRVLVTRYAYSGIKADPTYAQPTKQHDETHRNLTKLIREIEAKELEATLALEVNQENQND